MAKSPKAIKAVYVTGNVGLDALLAKMEQKAVKGVFRKAARAVAKQLKPKIVEQTPEGETGELKRSIKIRALKRGQLARVGVQIQTGEGFFKGKTFYGGFVELGTKRIAPRRFIRDEVDAFAGEAGRIWEQEVSALIAEDLPS